MECCSSSFDAAKWVISQVIAKIKLLANDVRTELGDALTNKVGKGNRPVGIIE